MTLNEDGASSSSRSVRAGDGAHRLHLQAHLHASGVNRHGRGSHCCHSGYRSRCRWKKCGGRPGCHAAMVRTRPDGGRRHHPRAALQPHVVKVRQAIRCDMRRPDARHFFRNRNMKRVSVQKHQSSNNMSLRYSMNADSDLMPSSMTLTLAVVSNSTPSFIHSCAVGQAVICAHRSVDTTLLRLFAHPSQAAVEIYMPLARAPRYTMASHL